jgi:hypothetical protein
VQIAGITVALGALGGILLGGALSSTAAPAADSSMTISWAGDTSSASALQPTRDPNGFEYDEFKDIKVTIAQTQNIIDQAVKIDVSGFHGGTVAAADGTGQIWSTAMNFMQAMECWGDPSSATFVQTCEWGGRFVKNNGLGFSVYGDNVYREASRDVSPTVTNAVDNPFVTRDGESFTGRQVVDSSNTKQYPILDEFNSDSSNELQGARINSDGTASFDFEMQSDIQAPQLGCGRNAADQQCYLVLVPRGTVFGGKSGGKTGDCSSIYAAGGVQYGYKTSQAIQAGSPINPGCDYWSNRIVVPMTFNQVAGVCPSGSEQRVIGSQLLISAMSSWQPKLCTTAGATFSFSTNPDSVARAQLLEQKADLAFTSYPIVKDQLEDPVDQTAFTQTTVAYAPVAIGAAAISFIADGRNGQINSMVLSPRLLAKLLTQSYIFELPTYGTDPGNTDFSQLAPVNISYTYLFQDPDFQALNPNWGDYISNPSIVLPGPSDGDAIAQIWKWIQSDSDARDFLNGKPDPWGMKINPYYLPAGSADAHVPAYDPTTGALLPTPITVGLSNLDGTPMSLATAPIAYFLKSDASQVPHVLGAELRRFDSIQAFPYVDDFVKAAVTTFRANPGAKTGWDPTAVSSNGTVGDWVSGGPQVPGQRFVMAVTDAAATARYDLTPIGLRAANGTTVTTPTTTSMAAAISSGLVTTSNAAVKQVDPSKVSASSYPLTTVVYAAVNLTSSTASDRSAISKLLQYVAGDGQTIGTQVGQLPVGYLPLTGDLQAQATASATAIANYTGASSSGDDGVNVGGNSSSSDYSSDGGATVGGDAAATSGPTITASGEHSVTGLTPAASAFPLWDVFLAVALGLGVVGALFAPLVIRGWGRT